MPILATHLYIKIIIIIFIISIMTSSKKQGLWSQRVVHLNPCSGTCYLCDLNKLCYAFWNSVSSSISRVQEYLCQKSFYKDYACIVYVYYICKYCSSINMPLFITSVHSNYPSLWIFIRIPLSSVLWLCMCHLTISCAVS